MSRKIISWFLSLTFIFQQTLPAGRQAAFAQAAAVELNLSGYFARMNSNVVTDKFRPVHLRYFSYDTLNNTFKVLIDKGDEKRDGSAFSSSNSARKTEPSPSSPVIASPSSSVIANPPEAGEAISLESETKQLLNYFLIGVTIPDEKFWVNLRPDSPEQVIDPLLEDTDIGKILLETDLQLKKDTALYTSPNTPEGKEYWDKLYKKASEFYGLDNVTIPTLTRPWIVPGEIIVRETAGSPVSALTRSPVKETNPPSAYIYKATLKVMLEADYLKEKPQGAVIANPGRGEAIQKTEPFPFSDSRAKALNEYSTQLIRELIIPKLTKEVNTSKRYAALRQVYYSLILSRWFKSRFAPSSVIASPSASVIASQKGEAISNFVDLIDSKDLSNLTSKTSWSKATYFQAYKKSFTEGEYNIKEPHYTPTGQVIRSYFSGGVATASINFRQGTRDSAVSMVSFAGSAVEMNAVVLDGDWGAAFRGLPSGKLITYTSPAEELSSASAVTNKQIDGIMKDISEALEAWKGPVSKVATDKVNVIMANVNYYFGHELQRLKTELGGRARLLYDVIRGKEEGEVRLEGGLVDRLEELLKDGQLKGEPLELTKELLAQVQAHAETLKPAIPDSPKISGSAISIAETVQTLKASGLTGAALEKRVKVLAEKAGIKADVLKLDAADVESHTYTFPGDSKNLFTPMTVNILYGKQRDSQGKYRFNKLGQVTVIFTNSKVYLKDLVVYDTYITAHLRERAFKATELFGALNYLKEAVIGASSAVAGDSAADMTQEKHDAGIISQALHTVINPAAIAEQELTKKYLDFYGVPPGAVLDGSFALNGEGNQGYYVEANERIFVDTVGKLSEFFKKRAERLGKPIKVIIKAGIGGQHTPFQAIADAFMAQDSDIVYITGEYELGKDFERSIEKQLKRIGASWDQVSVDVSSKSGSTDETMRVFVKILSVLLKNVADKENVDGKLFSRVVLAALHDLNFIRENGTKTERSGSELFATPESIISIIQRKAYNRWLSISEQKIRKILGIVLGNMVFETTDRPEKSRLSAFIKNSGLDEELGLDAPAFVEMFDNVGGRWTADLHMMLPLAFYEISAASYWAYRHLSISTMRAGNSKGSQLGNRILDTGITDIALVLPDELFWGGKAIEQNQNESNWQKGAPNLVAIKETLWKHQQHHYANKSNRLVINLSSLNIPEGGFNVENMPFGKISEMTRLQLALELGGFFTTFYAMTNTIGCRLIARAIREGGYDPARLDINDINNPVTNIFQENLFLLQPYVELGKKFLEERLKKLQAQKSRVSAIASALKEIKDAARQEKPQTNIQEIKLPTDTKSTRALDSLITQATEYAQKTGRKVVPLIYLESDKFSIMRDELVKAGVEWVMQGTGDQHISLQQVLSLPDRFLPIIVSFVPERAQEGQPAIGFAKGYLDGISDNLTRDYFSEAIYQALTIKRAEQGGKGIFLRMIDSSANRTKLVDAFRIATEATGMAGVASSAVFYRGQTISWQQIPATLSGPFYQAIVQYLGYAAEDPFYSDVKQILPAYQEMFSGYLLGDYPAQHMAIAVRAFNTYPTQMLASTDAAELISGAVKKLLRDTELTLKTIEIQAIKQHVIHLYYAAGTKISPEQLEKISGLLENAVDDSMLAASSALAGPVAELKTLKPDQEQLKRVSFPTAGWRSKFTEFGGNYSKENVYAVCEAGAKMLLENKAEILDEINRRKDMLERGEKKEELEVFINHDVRRYMGDYAREITTIYAQYGIKASFLDEAIPSPIGLFIMRQRGAALMVNLTASHNGPEWGGIELFDGTTLGLAHNTVNAAIERHLKSGEIETINYYTDIGHTGIKAGLINKLELTPFLHQYAAYLKNEVGIDVDLIKEAMRDYKLRAVYDGIFGTATVMLELAEILGIEDAYIWRQMEQKADAGGLEHWDASHDDNMTYLSGEVIKEKADIGLGNDQDADRMQIISERGDKYTPNNFASLFIYDTLLKLEKEAKDQGIDPREYIKKFSIVTTIPSSRLGLRLAAEIFGMPEENIYADTSPDEVSVGYRFVNEAIRKAQARGLVVILGYEESGGLSFLNALPYKDGIAGNLRALEMTARLKKEGKSISQFSQVMTNLLGGYYDKRVDRALNISKKEISRLYAGKEGIVMKYFMEELKAKLDKNHVIVLDGIEFKVKKLLTTDGLFIGFEDGSCICVRPSGTEPLFRVYPQSNDEKKYDALGGWFLNKLDEFEREGNASSSIAQDLPRANIGASDYQDDDLAPEESVSSLLAGQAQSGSTVEGPVGGIDLRVFNTKYELMGSFKGLNCKLPMLSDKDLQQMNLALEAKQIKQMIENGMTPSGERIKEFLAACCQKQELSDYVGEVAVWLAQICRIQEEEAEESAPDLKEAIVILENIAA